LAQVEREARMPFLVNSVLSTLQTFFHEWHKMRSDDLLVFKLESEL